MVKHDEAFSSIISFEYKISQKYSIFSENGYEELAETLKAMSGSEFVAVYLCEPYTLTINNFSGKMYILDTHRICKQIGGVGTAALVWCENAQPNYLCDWLRLRLSTSKVPETAVQMLILLTENT